MRKPVQSTEGVFLRLSIKRRPLESVMVFVMRGDLPGGDECFLAVGAGELSIVSPGAGITYRNLRKLLVGGVVLSTRQVFFDR